ncbi:hypothetical protein ACFWYW_28100 [Nonomuraea sp. NPDC059023]
MTSNLGLGREHTLTRDHAQAITRFERAPAIATDLGATRVVSKP